MNKHTGLMSNEDFKKLMTEMEDEPNLALQLNSVISEEGTYDESYKTNADTFSISLIEFAIINEYLFEAYRKPNDDVTVLNYGNTDSIGRVYIGGAYNMTAPWWFQTKFANDSNEYIFQTKSYINNRSDLITELHISVKTQMTPEEISNTLKKLKKIAFNHSKYVGKCIKVRLNENNFKGIEIIDISNFTTELILNETQRKFIDHFISRVNRGGSARYLLNGEPGTGKAQPLDAKILTPNGWITMGEIKIGDEVLTPDGKISKVLGVFPQGEKDIYKITFKDGRSTEACGEHLWKVFNGKKRKNQWSIIDTLSIKKSLDLGNKRLKLDLVSDKINVNNNKEFIIDAYLMGVLLGDGSFKKFGVSVSSGDDEILDSVRAVLNEKHNLIFDKKYDYSITRIEGKGYKGIGFENEYVSEVSKLGLTLKKSNTKFIPEKYKNGSLEQKYSLIQGLMDTDGTVDKSGHLSYSTTSYELAKDLQELIWSIGGICKLTNKQTSYTYKGVKKLGLPSYTLSIRYKEPKKLFRLSRKLDLISPNYQYSEDLKNTISSIEFIGSKEAQCIMIDDKNHLYITDDYIVTHNTESIREIIRKLTPKVTFVIPDFSTTDDLTIILESCEIFDNAVIIMDDIDLFLGSRDRGSYTMLLGQFLSFFDGVKKRKISLLASTNDKGLVDKAAERPGRFNMTLDYTFLTEDQIIKVCEIHLPKEYQIPEVYEALTGSISGKKAKITGAFIANLADNIKEMAEDENNWSIEDTISLIKESYKGFYMSQTEKNGSMGFKTS
jgi:hypothetical protein